MTCLTPIADHDAPDLDLAQAVDQEVRAYMAMDSPLYRLIALRLQDLADEIRFLGAETVADFEARLEAIQS